MDYQPNSGKSKDPETPKKVIEKVVVGTVVVKKKSIGQKIKDVFVEADFKSVFQFVVSDVLVPAARNMIVDASQKGVERMVYGPGGSPRSRGPVHGRVNFGGSPIYRTDYRSASTRPPSQISGPAYPRAGRNDFILDTKDEAENLLQHMHDILEMYQEVSVADLHELLGIPSSHTDQKWGWTNLAGSGHQQIREGWLIILPQAEAI